MSQSNKGDTNDIDEILDNAGVKEDYPDFKDLSKTHSPRAEAKQAIQNLIAQETNKAIVAELKWFLGMADIGHGVRRLAQDKLDELTADKEQA